MHVEGDQSAPGEPDKWAGRDGSPLDRAISTAAIYVDQEPVAMAVIVGILLGALTEGFGGFVIGAGAIAILYASRRHTGDIRPSASAGRE